MINTDVLEKACLSLDEAIELYNNSDGSPEISLAFRDAVIQRFEYTYELSWKIIQRWIKENASAQDADTFTRKELYRTAAKFGLIEDPQAWFNFHTARNLASHTYNDSNAADAFKAALDFSVEVKNLLSFFAKKDC